MELQLKLKGDWHMHLILYKLLVAHHMMQAWMR